MTDFVDKDTIGLTGPQYHVGVAEGEISDIVLMPGDPFRVQLIADMLDDAVEVAHKREYRTMNGTYKGRLITVCSSGMGCPSTAIGVEELARVGGRVFIRVGSTAALQPHVGVGDVIVSEGSLRNDGTTAAYVPPGYPAVPDFELTVMLKQVADELGAERGFASHAGLNATDDAFYAETPEWIANLSRLGMLNVEMESSALFVVARQRGLRAGDGLRGLRESRHRRRRLRRAEPAAAQRAGSAASTSPWRPSTGSVSDVVTINLHTHLEGCVRLETAAELAAAVGVEPPGGSWDEALVMRIPSDLTVFLAHVAAAYPLLGSHAALAARGARGGRRRRGRRVQLLRAPLRAAHARPARIRRRCGHRRRLRGRGERHGRHRDRRRRRRLCAAPPRRGGERRRWRGPRRRHAGAGVVGFDVAGDELLYPDLGPYVRPFQCAAAAGLGLTAHVAEAGPASNVRDAYETLGVRRIGHGTRLGGDAEVLAWSVDHGMCLEVCATSNVLTGAARSVAAHPIHTFLAAGCNVVLGDDNPITIDTTLSREVERLREGGLTAADLEPHRGDGDRVRVLRAERQGLAARRA